MLNDSLMEPQPRQHLLFKDMKSTISLCLILLCSTAHSQSEVQTIKVCWEDLAFEKMEDVYYDDYDAYYWTPTFTETALNLEGHYIMISGYIMCVDEKENFFIITKTGHRGLSCCSGGLEPDDAARIHWNSLPVDPEQFSSQVPVTLIGKLALNENDPALMNYTLSNVRLVAR